MVCNLSLYILLEVALTLHTQRLAVRLEMIGILALTAAALLGVLQRGHISPGENLT